MTDLDLTQEVHRTPDGSRPLIIGTPSRIAPRRLRSRQLSSGERTCQIAMEAAHQLGEPPASCLRVIGAGDHYLAYMSGGPPVEVEYAYCAGCAVAQWKPFGVREAGELS
jgi:hypothetical protein